jgi:adenylate cyclase
VRQTVAVRVDRSFAFIDLSGFTAFTDSFGDQDAVALLSTFRTVVRAVAADRAVRVDKWLGDGVMMVSVDPESLIGSVLEIHQRWAAQDQPLALRSGLARGQVLLLEGDDYIGSSVNTAARLCALAEPHEILAGPTIVPSSPADVEAMPIGLRRIRGLHDPVQVFALRHRADDALEDDGEGDDLAQLADDVAGPAA